MIIHGIPRFVVDKQSDFVKTEDAFSSKWENFNKTYHDPVWILKQKKWFIERFGWKNISNLNALSVSNKDENTIDNCVNSIISGKGNILSSDCFNNDSTKNHIELVFIKENGKTLSAIAFFGVAEKWAESLIENVAIDLIASVEKSFFAGKTELRLRVVDVMLL